MAPKMMFASHLIVGLLVLALWGIGTVRGAKDDRRDIINTHQGPPHRIASAHNHIEAQGHQGTHAHHGHLGHHGAHTHHGHRGHHGQHGQHAHHAHHGHHGLHGLHAHHGEHGHHPGLHGHHGLHGLGHADPEHYLGPHGHHAHGHGNHHANVGSHHQMYPEITTHTHHHHHIPKHEPHADYTLHNPEHSHQEHSHSHGHEHVHGHGQHHEPSEWYWFKISNRLPHDTVLNVQCRDDQGLHELHKDVLNHKFLMNFKMQDQEYWTCLMKFEGTKACKEVKVWEKLHSELDCEFCTWKVTTDGMFVKEWSDENKKNVWVYKHAWEDCDSGLPWDGK